MLPYDVTAELGKALGYLVFFLIGAGFGATLEVAGFGDSRRLAAQFYFKDMTVLKTMFTGIIVACILIFLTSAVGWMDFAQLAVNQTYLWPGILGGLIMGVGFVIGGYCPGTSIVSAASLKADGIVFFAGTMIGAGVFGESLSSFQGFWNSSFYERYLLSEWLGWSIGATVVGVTVMALLMFYAAEKTEEYVHAGKSTKKRSWLPSNKKYMSAAAVLFGFALLTWVIGQPDPARRWQIMGHRYEPMLTSREVFIHPLEYVKTWNDSSIKLITFDLRGNEEFAKFHLSDAKKAEMSDFKDTAFVAALQQLPGHGVVVLVSDDEAAATQAWQWLKVQGVTNLFILENGIQGWMNTFTGIGRSDPHGTFDLTRPTAKILDLFPKDSFKTKIKLKTNKRSAGLCS